MNSLSIGFVDKHILTPDIIVVLGLCTSEKTEDLVFVQRARSFSELWKNPLYSALSNADREMYCKQ